MATKTATDDHKDGDTVVHEETTVTSSESTPEGKGKKNLDRKLDEALEESFPGSDPVSISQPTGPEKHDR